MKKYRERKTITLDTLNKVREFMESRKGPVYKIEIREKLGVNTDSLEIALRMLKAKTDREGKIFI